MANYRRNLLKKSISNSASTEATKLLGKETPVAVQKTPNFHPQMKLSKRMKKKLERTGRTSTKEKITKGAELEAKIAKIKATPRPTLPNVGKPKINTVRPKSPAEKAALEQDLEVLNDETARLRQFLSDMISSHPDLTAEQRQEIRSKIASADAETLDTIKNIFNEDEGDWKDFYEQMEGTGGGLMDNDDYDAAVAAVMDELGIQY